MELKAVFCAHSDDRTAPVGSKLSNPWNLKDFHGNVVEWCWDWYADNPESTVTDYAGPSNDSRTRPLAISDELTLHLERNRGLVY
ncbi:SUMF1/EgtB/PvdO family nonheme iron enzyme [candidate division CSSED10-310 bacterium]|uniref:SUMF1/EgtB/PvdO family nonheme iron enzyme n=1 Tax=candidate division CSSED10-310 bacterium TaxID=2855610 RepID=A0ABV6Z6Y8_UNCC1